MTQKRALSLWTARQTRDALMRHSHLTAPIRCDDDPSHAEAHCAERDLSGQQAIRTAKCFVLLCLRTCRKPRTAPKKRTSRSATIIRDGRESCRVFSHSIVDRPTFSSYSQTTSGVPRGRFAGCSFRGSVAVGTAVFDRSVIC